MPDTPVGVVLVDTEQGLPDLEDLRARYRTVWFVLRRGGRPLSLHEMDIRRDATAHAGAALEQLIAEAHEEPFPQGPSTGSRRLPSIAVVIPTIVERSDELVACLDALAAVEYDRFEVVLVDNRRTIPDDDPLPAALAGRARVRCVREARPGISAARNAGVAATTADVVAFTDDDVHVDTGWLRAIGTRFAEHPDEDVVSGLVLPSELETPSQLMFERYYGGFSGERTFAPTSFRVKRPGGPPWARASVVARDDEGREMRRFALYGAGACGAGCNIAFRRTALYGPLLFDLALGTGTPARGGEDLAAMIAVLWRGRGIGYEPAATVHHQHRREYDELLRQMSGYGTGFTAMLTSLVLHDRGHLLGLVGQVPKAAVRLGRGATTRLRGHRPQTPDALDGATSGGERTFPPELARRELAGYLRGPGAYLRSRRAARVGADTARPRA
ncbi:glycosyltransferase [Actinomycetospora sp. DW7H6]|uniref:Glycosyltransferase n=2 Tax=Actinomycetospora lemnae TaxID=3019891 RepID=A0ABT5SVP4_9PSEU|nr:glycosyltransferase [Actinomycetospora sp. DW7H6]